MTKKILLAAVVTGAVTAGVFFLIHRLKNKDASDIILDFAEYALGG